MANFRERVSYRIYRAWRFCCLNWRHFIIIGIGLLGIAGVLTGVYLIFTSPPSGMTGAYAFMIIVSGGIFYLARTSKRGRFDYLLLDEDD